MSKPLKVLLVEGHADDAALIIQALRRVGFDPDALMVETLADFQQHLAADLDLILAEDHLPHFDGMQALKLVQEHALDVPFIIVTGAIDEERAVECMKQGASDYLMKDRLARLGPTIEHALEEQRLRKENAAAQQALRISQERLKLALEGANDGLWDWDIRSGRVYFSPRWETMLGFEPGEVEPHADSWNRLLHPEDKLRFVQALTAHLNNQTPYCEIEHRMQSKSGDWVWVLNRGKVVERDENGRPLRAAGTHTDVTARKQIEVTLEHLNTVLLAVRNVNQLITKTTDRDDLIRSVCDVLTETRGFHNAWIALFDETGRLTNYTVSGETAEFAVLVERLQRGDLPLWARQALAQPDVVITSAPDTECYDRPLSPQHQDCGVMSVRLSYGKHTYGILTVSIPSAFMNDPREVSLFAEVAEDIAYALHNLAAEDTLREQHTRVQMYLDIAGVILVALDSGGKIELINKKGCEILGYPEAELVGKNWFENFVPPAQREAVQAVFVQLMAGEMEPDEYFENEVVTHQGATRLIGWYNTVIRDESGNIAGTLSSGEDITERRQAEIARQEQHEFAAALSDIAAVLNSTLDFNTVIERILVSVGRVLPHDSANVMLIEDDHVRVIGHRGYERLGLVAWIEALRWRLTDVPNLLYQIETARPLVISNVANYEYWYPEPESAWIKSFASAPIVLDGRVVGFLNLDKADANFYSHKHANRLQAFANQASMAIKNARLYDMIQRHAAELEQRVTERTSELRESEARYRAIVEDQTELIARYLPDWTVTFANRAWCRYFGIQPDQTAGHNFLSFIHPEDRARWTAQIEVLQPDDPVVLTETRAVLQTGEVRWLQWTNRIILDDAGQFVEYQGVGRDITERRDTELKLRQSLAREIELSELKSRFVSMVSHEFRNPLAVILMNSDMMRRYNDRLSEDQRQEYLSNIRTHVKGMTDLLEDLLLLSQSEAGKLEIRPETLDASDVCKQIIDEVWATSGPDRDFRYTPSGDCEIVTDPKLFRLIVTNLVSNAAKYTLPGGHIDVTLRCENARLSFQVRDDGIGIPEADQAQMFETFHRASNVGKRTGTGLGLTLVKQCVEQLAGTLTFESQEDAGSSFTVELPRLTRRANAS